MRRFVLLLLLVGLSGLAFARGSHSSGGRSYSSHTYSSHSYSSHSYSSRSGGYHPRSYSSGSSGYHTRSSSSSHRSEHVHGYYRKDGTYVNSYTRSAPGTATHSRSTYSTHSSTTYATGGGDSHGRIHRSAAAKDEFKRKHPCPSTGRSSGACPGYVIDHVQALACGGADAPSNMQWQTVAEGKEKDKTERIGCH